MLCCAGEKSLAFSFCSLPSQRALLSLDEEKAGKIEETGTQGRIYAQEMQSKPLTMEIIIRRGPLPDMGFSFYGSRALFHKAI